jgi:RNA polymerase sigma factor (sigma-70 family)
MERSTDDDELDRQRFESLFDRHRRSVLGYALRRVDDPADAADALAETFLVAWRRLPDVPEGDDARPWLLGVARRVLANQRRGDQRRHGLSERLGRELAGQLPTAEPGTDAELVRQALERLSDGDRELLLLSGWEGLTPAQIAVVVGARSVAVRSRLHRARRRLRAHLTALGWDGVRDERPAATYLDLAKETAR